MHTTTLHHSPSALIHAVARPLVRTLSASLVLAASAWVAVPVGPVPVTLQTLAVVVLAAVGGRSLAVSAVVAYLLEGAMGLPVFAQGAMGLPPLLGPTGGYLFGFVAGAYATATLQRAGGPGLVSTGLSMLAGHAVILACGAAWLSGFVGLRAALSLGVVPFALDTVIKTAVGVLLATGVRETGLWRTR